MSLNAGARLGPYEVVRSLGAGGMGEVYRATDTNLKRQVALKVLPAGVAGDAERLARFQREAEVLAALNHPPIAQIYGLEKSADTTALVMELVEGEDLAQRIARGLIPLDEALPIAKQIAEALEAAHEQGIIHRDLKPANIKVRADGTVKVLDFGLAKALESPSSLQTPASSLSLSPTLTSPAAMTGIGTILGTAAYMAPEQARGKAVDRRADMWAFGCVLFEMLAGGRPFDGETITDVLGAVVRAEPDWSRLPRGTPLDVRRLLRRCLTKDARGRQQSAGDARLEIEEAMRGADGPAPAAGPSGRLRVLPAAAAALTVIAVSTLAFIAYSAKRPTDPQPVNVIRFTVQSPDGEDLASAAHWPWRFVERRRHDRLRVWIRWRADPSRLRFRRQSDAGDDAGRAGA